MEVTVVGRGSVVVEVGPGDVIEGLPNEVLEIVRGEVL